MQTVSHSIEIKQKLSSSDLQSKKIKKKFFRVSGQKIEPVKQTKYLGIYLDEHLTWNFQISQIKSKLSRSSGLLARLRYCVKLDFLRTVYFAIFDSILRYGIQVWGQNRNQAIKDIEKRQPEFLISNGKMIQ